MTQCPVCKAGKDKWEEVVEGAGRVWATEHKLEKDQLVEMKNNRWIKS